MTTDPKTIWNELKEANDLLLNPSTVTFRGGPADGQTFDIPDGVMEASIESAFGPIQYERGHQSPYEFFLKRP